MARNKAIYSKQEIINTAFNIIKSEGIASFSARRLAKELGVSSMTIYNYVKNINEIKKEVIIKGFNILYKNVYEDITHHKDDMLKDNKVKAICRLTAVNMYEFAEEYKEIYTLMFLLSDDIRKDPEVRPLYGFYSKLAYRFKLDDHKKESMNKSFYLFEKIVHALISDKLNNLEKISAAEFYKYIDYSIDKLF